LPPKAPTRQDAMANAGISSPPTYNKQFTNEQKTVVNNGLLTDIAPSAGKSMGVNKAFNANLFDDIDAELNDNY